MVEIRDISSHLNACRVCLGTEKLLSIFSSDEDDMQYSYKIMLCSTVLISKQDNLSPHICHECIANLNVAYNFKKLCESTDESLRNYIGDASKSSFPPNEESSDSTMKLDTNNIYAKNPKDVVCYDTSDDEKLINIIAETLSMKGIFEIGTRRKGEGLKITNLSSLRDLKSNTTPKNVDIKDECEIDKTKKKSRKLKDKKEYVCSFCHKIFQSNSQFVIHQRYHTGERPFVCIDCRQSFFIKADLLRHRACRHDKQKPYKCSECAKCFSLKSGLIVHMRTHTGEKPYKCLDCGACFSQSGSLKEHKRTHTGEQPLVCEECGKGFASHSALARHKRIHSGERRGQCNICGKKFFSSNYLQHHMTVHTGDKPCKCKVCGKRFSMPSTLLKHMSTHDPTSKTVCAECGLTVSNIMAHMISHSSEKRHKCPHCEKKFKQLTGLNYHLAVHADERNFPCTLCDKKFRNKHTLKEHTSIHSPDRPFKCEICQVAFRSLSFKKRHNRLYHSNNEQSPKTTKVINRNIVKVSSNRNEGNLDFNNLDTA